MTTEAHEITVSDIQVQVVRKAIKNLHLGVYPPNGRVRVAAPLALNEEAVRLAVIGKLGWIKRQQAQFEAQPRQTEREMVSGESHYFLGQRYRLRVIYEDGPQRVTLASKTMLEMRVRPGASVEEREQLLHQWYRAQLRPLAAPLIEKWQAALGVQLAGWAIKRMKTRWGTCNVAARRILLNSELAKHPMPCIEYLVVHELVHLLERDHGERFVALMNRHLPAWRSLRQDLNAGPLAHETWTC
jgi:hypothetical protein